MGKAFINKDTLVLIFLLCLYKILLKNIYILCIVPFYSSEGFFYNAADVLTESTIWVLFLFFSLVLISNCKKNILKLSTVTLWILFLINFVPFTVLSTSGIFQYDFIIGNFLYWGILLLSYHMVNNENESSFSAFLIGKQQLGYGFLISFVLFHVMIILYIYFRYMNFSLLLDLSSVYDLRFAAREFDMPIVMKYLFAWSKTLLPFVFSLSYINNIKLLSFFLLVVQFLSFSIDGSKTPMLILLLNIIIIFIVKRKPKINYYKLFLYGLLCLSLLTCILAVFNINSVIASFLYFRTEFLPVLIGSNFYDFFTTHEPDYFRTSILSRFGVASPYADVGINFLIGGLYSSYGYQSSANNGLISDAIANMGIVGIFVMPLVLVALLKLFDKCSLGMHNGLIITLGIQFALILVNTFLMTSLLTNGLLVLLFLLAFVNRNVWQTNNRV